MFYLHLDPESLLHFKATLHILYINTYKRIIKVHAEHCGLCNELYIFALNCLTS